MSTKPLSKRAPYVPGSETSKAAADSQRGKLPAKRQRVLDEIRAAAWDGLTDDEIEHRTGYRHQTASARRRELVLAGLVFDSKRRRWTSSGRQATVWVARAYAPSDAISYFEAHGAESKRAEKQQGPGPRVAAEVLPKEVLDAIASVRLHGHGPASKLADFIEQNAPGILGPHCCPACKGSGRLEKQLSLLL